MEPRQVITTLFGTSFCTVDYFIYIQFIHHKQQIMINQAKDVGEIEQKHYSICSQFFYYKGFVLCDFHANM